MVQCDAEDCCVWVHTECDNIASVEDYTNKKYFCPACREAQQPAPAGEGRWDVVRQGGEPAQAAADAPPEPRLGFRRSTDDLPDRVRVMCNGMAGQLLPKELSVVCLCSSCGAGSTPWGLPAWERHTGSRAKKYKWSVKVETGGERSVHLGQWMEQMLGDTAAEFLPRRKHVTVTAASQGLANPLRPRWPSDICAVCDDASEHETNLLVTCDRCHVSVHEECYVTKRDPETGTHLCTVCAMGPDARPTDVQCCLCPVQGGALKPTDDGRWAHVMCGLWVPETVVPDANTVGLVRNIPSHRWRLVCEICNIRWGAPVQCHYRQCFRAYHPMCACIAGYCMKFDLMKDDSVEPRSFCFKHSRGKPPTPNRNSWARICQLLFPNLGHVAGADVAAASSTDGSSGAGVDSDGDQGGGDVDRREANGVGRQHPRRLGSVSGATPAAPGRNGHMAAHEDSERGAESEEDREEDAHARPGPAGHPARDQEATFFSEKKPIGAAGSNGSPSSPYARQCREEHTAGTGNGQATANGHANGNSHANGTSNGHGNGSMYLRHHHGDSGARSPPMPASMSEALHAVARGAVVGEDQCVRDVGAEHPGDAPEPGAQDQRPAAVALGKAHPSTALTSGDVTADAAPLALLATSLGRSVPRRAPGGSARCEPYRPAAHRDAARDPPDSVRGHSTSQPPLPSLSQHPPASSAGRARSDVAHAQGQPPEPQSAAVALYDVCGFTWHPEVAHEFRLHKMHRGMSKEQTLTVPDRIKAVRERVRDRLCFGKSAIHGWGLFARDAFQQGEMVIEYMGELVRGPISDLRAHKYLKEGKGCYLFKIDNNEIIDATNHGNIARLVNHSCQPSCYAKIIDGRDKQRHVMFFARRDIKAGEEITYDYKFEVDENDKVGCHCGAEGCRGYM
eukprot:jgi/Mesvir1/8382/Mv12628-RA.2